VTLEHDLDCTEVKQHTKHTRRHSSLSSKVTIVRETHKHTHTTDCLLHLDHYGLVIMCRSWKYLENGT